VALKVADFNAQMDGYLLEEKQDVIQPSQPRQHQQRHSTSALMASTPALVNKVASSSVLMDSIL